MFLEKKILIRLCVSVKNLNIAGTNLVRRQI